MRQPPSVLRYLVILLALCFAARAYADDRTEARTHYQAGVKFYASADYRSAIREFSAAQQLVPADLNNYNLALCYDKLGDAEPATQYYRAFLDKQPNTDKRAEIEASISRLEAAARSAASKKAEEARKVDEARKAEEAKKAAEAARAEEAKRPVGPVVGPSIGPAGPPVGPAGPMVGPAPGPAVGPAPGPAVGPAVGPAAAPPPAPVVTPPAPAVTPPAPAVGGIGSSGRKPHRGPAVGGSIGTPSTASPVSTGDAELDRINGININQIRDERVGGAGSGMADTRGGPAAAANAGPSPSGPPSPPGPSGVNGQPLPGVPDQAPQETPVYKKWWFWAVVAVSGYVVYELANSSSTSSQTIKGRELPPTGRAAAQPGGLTLLRW
jgi:hypothetical protein